MTTSSKVEVAVYYFPNYHVDPRNEHWHGAGWSEWKLVQAATPRFEGHQQPKVPLWGYENEADPQVMAKKIAAASDHGIDTFIFDWYWHEEGPYLERALEEGFLGAPNNDRLKFSLMWANHDWVDIHPAQRSRPYNALAEGAVSPEVFVKATNHMIEKYFHHPSYWRVDGGLYVSFYELASLVIGLGGVEQTKAVLEDFRKRVRAAGLGGLHLNAVVWGQQILPNEQRVDNVQDLLEVIGFDSVTSYIWIHHVEMEQFPFTPYDSYREQCVSQFEVLSNENRLPYYPNVTMGWDPSPRTIQTDEYAPLGYPFTPILQNNTPEQFRMALEAAKDFLQQRQSDARILTINAWNEWTEGSYLEPDTIHGMQYLEAIKEVFGENE